MLTDAAFNVNYERHCRARFEAPGAARPSGAPPWRLAVNVVYSGLCCRGSVIR